MATTPQPGFETPIKPPAGTEHRRCRSQTAVHVDRMRKTGSNDYESPIKTAYNQPHFNHFKHLTVRETAGIKEQSPFGVEPFVIPKKGLDKRVCSYAPSQSKNICFIDHVQKDTKWKPGPIYVPHSDWRKNLTAGKFGKYKKITFTEDQMKWEKNRRPAGPTSYDNHNLHLKRSLGAFKLTDKNINFTDEAKWYAA